MKTLKIKLEEYIDNYGDCRYQEITSEDENINYSVSNLDECPEDAIISRDLFSADEYIDALKLGMELARKGYDNISIERIEKWLILINLNKWILKN